MKMLVDPPLGLPGELLLARPVAAQADLDVAARVDVALLDQAPHRGAVRDLDPEDLLAGVGVGVEVDEADRRRRGGRRRRGCRARRCRGRRRARSGSRRRRAPGRRCARSPRGWRRGRRAGPARRRSRPRAARRSRRSPPRGAGPGGQLAARIARGPKRAPGRSETRSSVGAPTIATSAPGQLGRVLGVGHAGEARQAGEVGLLAELAPALERIDHVVAMLRPRTRRPSACSTAPLRMPVDRLTRAALAALLAAARPLPALGAADAGAGVAAAARRRRSSSASATPATRPTSAASASCSTSTRR